MTGLTIFCLLTLASLSWGILAGKALAINKEDKTDLPPRIEKCMPYILIVGMVGCLLVFTGAMLSHDVYLFVDSLLATPAAMLFTFSIARFITSKTYTPK